MFQTKTKAIVGGVLLALATALAGSPGALLGIETAHAVVLIPGTGSSVQGMLGDDLVSLMSHLAMLNTFLHILLLIILQFLGYLMQADFFNDQQMMGALYSIWRLSRDIMNIGFAIMLIGVSFYVIITAKSDMIKEKLVNFVVAVILVNLSWFFPRVIIDVANVLTAAVYTVPSSLGWDCKTFNDQDPPAAENCQVITEVIIFPSPVEEQACTADPSCSCIFGIECHKKEDFQAAAPRMKAAHAMINGLAVSFAKITLLPKIPSSVQAGALFTGNTAPVLLSLQIAMNVLMALAIQLGVVLPLVGLGVGLLIRILILWITTAFMPFTFLGYVINGKLGTEIFGFETDVWKEFINAAFLPTLVAVPFTIGFVMLSAAATLAAPPMSAFPLTMSVPLISGVKSWWALLWIFAAIGIMWSGAFAALSRSKVASKFTDKIKGFGESVGGGLAYSPLLLPLPLPGGSKGMNLGTLVHAPKIAADSIRLAASGTTGKSALEIFGERFAHGANTPVSPADLATKLSADRTNTDKIVQALRELDRGGNRDRNIEILKEATAQTSRSNVDALTMLRDAMTQSAAGSTLNNPDLIQIVEREITTETPTPPPAAPPPPTPPTP